MTRKLSRPDAAAQAALRSDRGERPAGSTDAPDRQPPNRKEIAVNANLTFFALRRRSATAAGAALLALGLAACSSTTEVRYDKAYPIEVTKAAQMVELPVAKTLSSFDAARVAELGRDFLKRGQGEVTVAYPKSKGKSRRIVHDATEQLLSVGVARDQILRGPYDVKADGNRGVVVYFYGPTAKPTKCPHFKGDPNLDQRNRTPLNFGCAYQQNIAAMLENPTDIVAPRPVTPGSADRRRKVLSAYVAGEKTGSELQQMTKPKED